MLALKLLLVPAFLLALSLVGRRFGPAVAGWLAGLPVVTGPILFFITIENGTAFGAGAAVAATSAVFAAVAFGITYAHAAQRLHWPAALACALLAWTVAVSLVSQLPASPLLSLAVAVGSLALAPSLFPAPAPLPLKHSLTRTDMALRMLAGAGLTLAVSGAAAQVGSAWSGLLAVFPVLSVVFAASSHRANGGPYVATLLRGLTGGLVSFTAFCVVLSWALVPLGTGPAFGLAVVASLAAQVATRKR